MLSITKVGGEGSKTADVEPEGGEGRVHPGRATGEGKVRFHNDLCATTGNAKEKKGDEDLGGGLPAVQASSA